MAEAIGRRSAWRTGFVAAVLILSVAAGCASGPPQPTAGPSGVDLFLPMQQDSGGPIMLALANGALMVHDGCIWLHQPTGHEYLVVWPAASRVDAIDGRVQISDSGGQRAFIGETVELFGGELASDDDRTVRVETMIGRSVPASCRTTEYWIGGLYLQQSPS